MKNLRCVLTALAAAVGLTLVAVPFLAAQTPTAEADLQATLIQQDAAQVEFHNGRPAAVKALWSHAQDVTLTGGAGGGIEKGWKNVSARLDWASAQYTKGAQTNERVKVAVSGDFAYVVQYEHIRFHVPGKANESKRDYRVTTVFRREPAGWRVVHRHADTLLTRQTPR
ncbi:YybH family protein [Lysobacter cavernae]|uniref:YybH family protein n=1 Tax=Lysobacter cavernae TaxID=1685901 RepID=A0ABV7RWI6_9GAMM